MEDTSQKQLARDVSGRVQVRLMEESPSWEAWKRCHDVCLSRDGASCFREVVPPSFTPPRATSRGDACTASLCSLTTHHPDGVSSSSSLLQAWHRPDLLPSQEDRKRHHLPRQDGKRSLASFSDLLSLESAFISSTYSPNCILDSYLCSEEGPPQRMWQR